MGEAAPAGAGVMVWFAAPDLLDHEPPCITISASWRRQLRAWCITFRHWCRLRFPVVFPRSFVILDQFERENHAKPPKTENPAVVGMPTQPRRARSWLLFAAGAPEIVKGGRFAAVYRDP